jgi:hypothetical protein
MSISSILKLAGCGLRGSCDAFAAFSLLIREDRAWFVGQWATLGPPHRFITSAAADYET